MPVPNPNCLPALEYEVIVRGFAKRIGCQAVPSQDTGMLYLIPEFFQQTIDHFNVTTKKFSVPFEFRNESAVVRFTGWKATVEEMESAQRIRLVGQWFATLYGPPRSYCINLPGLESGAYFPGSTINVGTKRLNGCEPDSEVKELIERGYRNLEDFVETSAGVKLCRLSQMSA